MLKLERTDVGTVALMLDGAWRRPTWVHVIALDVVLPADARRCSDATWCRSRRRRWPCSSASIRNGSACGAATSGYTLIVDDDVDAVVVKSGADGSTCASSWRRPRRGRSCTTRACRDQWRAPNAHVPLPARLRTVDEHVHARVQWIPDAAPMLAKAKFPDGRRAALVITDHADQTTARTFAALVYGRSDKPSPTMGLLAHHLRITKSLFAHGTDRPQLESPEVVRLADQLYVAGSEIVPHSADAEARRATGDAWRRSTRSRAGTRAPGSIISPRPTARRSAIRAFASSGKFGIADLLGRARLRVRLGRGRSRAGAAEPVARRSSRRNARRRCGRSDGSTSAARRACGCSARSGRFSRPSTSTICTRRRRSIASSASAGCTSRTRISRPIIRRTPSSG